MNHRCIVGDRIEEGVHRSFLWSVASHNLRAADPETDPVITLATVIKTDPVITLATVLKTDPVITLATVLKTDPVIITPATVLKTDQLTSNSSIV